MGDILTNQALRTLLLITLNVFSGGAFVAFLRTRPAMQKLRDEKEAAVEALKRDDMDDMRNRIVELEKRVETASGAAHAAEMKLVYAVNAVQLLAAKIRSDNPDDPALKQAQDLLSAATTGGLPGWGGALGSKLADMKAMS